MYVAELPMKMPSANEYIDACRTNKFKAAKMKANIESHVLYYLRDLPKFEKPIRIHFLWVEGNKRRDYDNICFSKKFVLDAMVKGGYLKDDNRKNVKGFSDDFAYGKDFKVIMEVEEIE